MHFTYARNPSRTELRQGDVLRRTERLNAVLEAVHPHYRDAKYRAFMVLTQSCDLTIRQGASVCKSRYLTVAPVRTVDVAVSRFLKQQSAVSVKSELPIYPEKTKSKASEFLQRLFNNNEPGYFFLDSEGTELEVDCVACLNLSIALRAADHYSACLEAKTLELTETFQAKLGWLVGQLYSRVGTPDMGAESMSLKVKNTLRDVAHFVPDKTIEAIEAAYGALAAADPEVTMTARQVAKASSSAPTLRRKVIDRALTVLEEAGLDPNLVRTRLESDAALQTLLRG